METPQSPQPSQPPQSLDYISQLILGGYKEDAQRGLATILEADPGHAGAWALTAWIAPDSERCVQALQKVVETSRDPRLTQWASRGLKLVEHIGTLDETPPPVLRGARVPQLAPRPELAPTRPDPAQKKPALQPGSTAHTLAQAGGAIMIGGMLVMIIAIVSEPIADLFTAMGISAGFCGIGLLAIGAAVAFIGYQRRGQ